MRILILKDELAYSKVNREKLFSAHVAGYWKEDLFHMKKNRFGTMHKFTAKQLGYYIEGIQLLQGLQREYEDLLL